MKAILENLDGHKTQIFSVVGLIFGYLIANNVIDESLGNMLLSVVGVLLGVSISHHEKKKNAVKKKSKSLITDNIHE